MKDKFLDGAPNGSIGLANKSGCMTSELFLKVLKHVAKHAMNMARDAGISLLTFPQDTTTRYHSVWTM